MTLTWNDMKEMLIAYITDPVIIAAVGFFGITLTDIDMVFKILVSIAVFGYTIHRTYYMIKDHKIKKENGNAKHTD